jgi:hypothetical protein
VDAIHLDLIPRPAPSVVGQMLKDEAVLVLPQSGKVQVLNEVGARIWQLMDGARSLSQIAAVVCAEYQVELQEAEQDVQTFVRDLHARGAIELQQPE